MGRAKLTSRYLEISFQKTGTFSPYMAIIGFEIIAVRSLRFKDSQVCQLSPRHPGSFQSGASVARTTRRNTTQRLPSAGPEALSPEKRPPHLYPHLPASRCRFSLPFVLPLLVAASRPRLAGLDPFMVLYYRLIADVEGIGELKLVSYHSSFSLITHHSHSSLIILTHHSHSSFSLIIHHSSFITHHSSLPASRFTLLLSPVIAENLIPNCQLNQFFVPSAPAFALYLQELQ